jgi:hypothetical protein
MTSNFNENEHNQRNDLDILKVNILNHKNLNNNHTNEYDLTNFKHPNHKSLNGENGLNSK